MGNMTASIPPIGVRQGNHDQKEISDIDDTSPKQSVIDDKLENVWIIQHEA